MDNMKLNKIIGYIKQYPFEYEVQEVEENLSSILLDYGIEDIISEEETQVLRKELTALAEKYEFKEVLHLTFQEMGMSA